MKLEVGKTYVTRDGNRVRVLCTDRNDAEYPVIGLTPDGRLGEYTASGRYYSNTITDEQDLAREATETVTLYVYQDGYGDVYALSHGDGDDGYIKTIEVEL